MKNRRSYTGKNMTAVLVYAFQVSTIGMKA